MVARTRRVVWAESARHALDEVIAYIAQESPGGAASVLIRALDVAASLSAFAERSRVVKEVGESTLREVSIYKYRLLYRIREDTVVIRAFLHGARDFSTWRQEQDSEP